MAKQTSRVFDTHDALVALMVAAAWPAHPTTGKTPTVVDCDMQPPYPAEMIVVVGTAPTPPNPGYVTAGDTQSQMEQFTLQIAVGTRVPNQSRVKTKARLKELCEVVQSELRNQTTGQCDGGFVTSAGSPGPLWWSVSQIGFNVFLIGEGFGGYSELNVTFNARI